MKIEIKKLPKMKVAYVRHVGPYMECKKAWETLCNWAKSKNLLTQNVKFVGICYDDPDVTEPSKIRFDACITVDKDIDQESDIKIKTIESQTYASTIHIGPYEKLHETYAAICGSWASKENIEIKSEPSIEIYLNDPETTPKDKLMTEVNVPIISK